jgi:CheY-like chemotaxis protein
VTDPIDLRVLVVDDDPDQRLLVRRLFERAGFTDVVEAPDAATGVQRASAHRPDLVVLDVAMPGRSGIDVLPELHATIPDTPIVIVSNLPRRRLGETARARGAVGYVEKRVPAERLVGEILTAAALAEEAVATASTRLPADRLSARRARRFIREALGTVDETLVDSVQLLVSELVTNAVVHASSSPIVEVRLTPTTVRVEVHDDDPRPPVTREPDVAAPGGRGLRILDQVATRWGSETDEGGKVVWFELDRSAAAS